MNSQYVIEQRAKEKDGHYNGLKLPRPNRDPI